MTLLEPRLTIVLVTLLLLILPLFVVLIAVLLGVRVFRGGHSPTPHDVIKMRYAKGEITKEQYEEMRKELET